MQTTTRVRVTFRNPATPSFIVEIPVTDNPAYTRSRWTEVIGYFEARGVDHPELNYRFQLESVRTIEVISTTTVL